MADHADVLLAELDASDGWPLQRERRTIERVRERKAFRRGHRDTLKRLAGWATPADGVERPYLLDPLPKRIAQAYADFLFAEDPAFTVPDETDQANLDEVVAENRLPANLHRAARWVVSEGEAWWKIHVNKQVAQVPMVDWYSRLSVIPLLYGDRLLACGFVVERCRETLGEGDDMQTTVWRHVEVHTDGRVVNVIYEGTNDTLGERRDVAARPETEMLQPEWAHGLPMLAGRVVNEIDDDPALGDSEYDQVQDELLALNEAMTIASENARLTGKDRIFAAGRFRRSDGTFDASMEVFEVDSDGSTLGESGDRPPIFAVEKTYDADPLWLHVRNLVGTILSRVGLVPQFVGQDVDGQAESGTAIRLRFMPTTNAAKGKAREWDATLPVLAGLLLRVLGLEVESGGFGRTYRGDDTLPSVERGDVLPVDEGETIEDNAMAVTAEIRSRRTAIAAQHPDWSREQVDDELAEIGRDTSLSLPGAASE